MVQWNISRKNAKIFGRISQNAKCFIAATINCSKELVEFSALIFNEFSLNFYNLLLKILGFSGNFRFFLVAWFSFFREIFVLFRKIFALFFSRNFRIIFIPKYSHYFLTKFSLFRICFAKFSHFLFCKNFRILSRPNEMRKWSDFSFSLETLHILQTHSP